MHPLPRLPRQRWGVFTAQEAYAAGWRGDELARAVRRERLVRLRRGVFVPAWADEPVSVPRRRDIDLARSGIAASLTTPAATVGLLPSTPLWGLPTWAPRPRACVVVDDGRTRVPGLHVHRTPIGSDAVEVAGFRITRPVRTVVDIACEFGTEAGLVVADAGLAAGLFDVDDLKLAVDAGEGRTGIGAARLVPALADHRAESPLESRSRWQCVRHGVPPPQTQVLIYDLHGTFLGRSDFFWEEGVVGEADGAGKLAEQRDRSALLVRQTALLRVRLRMVRWGPRDVDPFEPTAAWINEEIAAAAADPRPRLWRAVPT